MQKIVIFLLLFTGIAVFSARAESLRYPGVLVLVDEYVDGAKSEKSVAQETVKNALKESGFRVRNLKNPDQSEILPVFTVYAGKARRMGAASGADVILTARADSNLVRTDLPYGTGVFTYQARIESRLVRVSDGRVISMKRIIDVEVAPEKETASREALLSAGGSLAEYTAEKIKDAWRKEITSPARIKIRCINADKERVFLLKKALRFMSGTGEAEEKAFEGDKAVLEVEFFGSTEDLLALLRNLDAPLMDTRIHKAGIIDVLFIVKEKDISG